MREEGRGSNQENNIRDFPHDIPLPKGILPDTDVRIGPGGGEVEDVIIGPDPQEAFRELRRLQEEWAEERRQERKERWRRVLRSLDK